ncbi:27998_t:CDS:1, partial [Dentiscutata erythropus]
EAQYGDEEDDDGSDGEYEKRHLISKVKRDHDDGEDSDDGYEKRHLISNVKRSRGGHFGGHGRHFGHGFGRHGWGHGWGGGWWPGYGYDDCGPYDYDDCYGGYYKKRDLIPIVKREAQYGDDDGEDGYEKRHLISKVKREAQYGDDEGEDSDDGYGPAEEKRSGWYHRPYDYDWPYYRHHYYLDESHNRYDDKHITKDHHDNHHIHESSS